MCETGERISNLILERQSKIQRIGMYKICCNQADLVSLILVYFLFVLDCIVLLMRRVTRIYQYLVTVLISGRAGSSDS